MTIPTPATPNYLDDGKTTYTTLGANYGDQVFNIGSGTTAWNGVAVVNVASLNTATGDETYSVVVQGSVDNTFANPQSLGSVMVSVTGQALISVYAFNGGVLYPYMRLQLVMAGTLPSINLTAFVLPFSAMQSLSFGDLVTLNSLVSQNAQATNAAVLAWATGTATGGPNGDGRYPLYDASGNSTLVASFARTVSVVQKGDPGPPGEEGPPGTTSFSGLTNIPQALSQSNPSGTLYASNVGYSNTVTVASLMPAQAGADVTGQNLALGIVGQSPFATGTGFGYLTGIPNALLLNARGFLTAGNVAYGPSLMVADLQPAQPNSDVTSLNQAANVAGQGSLATLSSVAYGSSNVTGFGALAALAKVTTGSSGQLYSPTYGYLTDGNIYTPLGIASSVSGQGSLATLSSVAYGSSNVTGFGALAALSNGSTLTAGAIAGQSPFATYQAYTPSQIVSPNYNLLYNGDCTLGVEGWTSLVGTLVQVPSGGASAGTAYVAFSTNGIGINDTAVTAGLSYSFQGWLYTGGLTGGVGRLIVQWYNAAKTTIISSVNWGVQAFGVSWTQYTLPNQTAPSGAAFARFYIDTSNGSTTGSGATFSSGGCVAWSQMKLEQGTVCTPMSAQATTGALYMGGTSINALMPAQPGSDKTSLNQAASVSGQGSLATLSSVAYGSSNVTGFGALAALAKVTTGSSGQLYSPTYGYLTDTNIYTPLGVAASVSGQSPWATFSGYSTNVLTTPYVNAVYNSTFKLGQDGWTFLNNVPTFAATTNDTLTSGYGVLQTSGSSGYYDLLNSSGTLPISSGANVYISGQISAQQISGAAVSGSDYAYVQVAWCNPANGAVVSYSSTVNCTSISNTPFQLQVTAPTSNVPAAGYWSAQFVCGLYKASASGTSVQGIFRSLYMNANGFAPWNDARTYGATYLGGTSINALMPAQASSDVTSLNQAATVAGQGSLATLSRISTGSSGQLYSPTYGYLTDTNIYTPLGIASSVSGQGSLATLSSVAYGSSNVTGFGALAALAKVTTGSSGQLYSPTYGYLTDGNIYTPLGIASSVSGQGPLATSTAYSYLTAAPGTGGNWCVNSDFKKAFYGWSLSPSATGTVSQPSGAGYMSTAQLYYPSNIAAGSYIDPLATYQTWIGSFVPNQFSLPVPTGANGGVGTIIYAGCQMGQRNITGQLYLLGFNASGTLEEAAAWSGALDYGTDSSVGNGDPAHYKFVGGTYTLTSSATRWVALMVRMDAITASSGGCYVWVSRMQLGILPPGQTTVPVYTPGSADPYSDQTSVNQAATVAGQGSLATLSSVAYGSSNVTGFGTLAALAKVTTGSSGQLYSPTYGYLTDTNIYTPLGIASSVSGQSPWATYGAAIPGFLNSGINYQSQNGNSSTTGTLDCAWISCGTYGNGGTGWVLSPFMSNINQTGRIVLGNGLPINTQLGSSYVYSNSAALSAASSGTITIASQTLYIVGGVTYSLPSGSVGGCSVGSTYLVYYNTSSNAYVAISSGNSGYLTNPSLYIYLGAVIIPASGSNTGGGNKGGIQP